MKKYWHITWMLVVMLFTLAACSDDDDDNMVIDEAWKEMNLAAFDARLQDAKTDTTLFTINSESGNGQIICKILKKAKVRRQSITQVLSNAIIKVVLWPMKTEKLLLIGIVCLHKVKYLIQH